MDEALRRTLSGNLYRVKGYIQVPFEITVSAIDQDDAEELVDEIVRENKDRLIIRDEEKVEIDEVIIQEDE